MFVHLYRSAFCATFYHFVPQNRTVAHVLVASPRPPSLFDLYRCFEILPMHEYLRHILYVECLISMCFKVLA